MTQSLARDHARMGGHHLAGAAHGNFAVLPVVQRGPYEYSSSESIECDFLPQHVVVRESFAPAGGMLPVSVVAQREV